MENKTKIIVTMGPSIEKYEVLLSLVKEGARGFRINFSHGDPSQWYNYINNLKSVEKELSIPLGIIGDLQGPNIRIGQLINQINLKKDDIVQFFYGNKSETNDIPLPYEEFFKTVERGDVIQLADGAIQLIVLETSPKSFIAKTIAGGVITSRKSISIKDKDIEIPYVTEKDERDIEFACNNDFSHLMASFVESKDNIFQLKELLKKKCNKQLNILAKIETKRGVYNVEEILKVADGIVVARGDLGTHFPMETLPTIQKDLISKSIVQGKPSIVATQLLSSMLNSPIPTRSEIVDIYNAVQESANALMLTNETSIGNYPIDAVRWLKKVIIEAEKNSAIVYPVKPIENSLAHRFALGISEFSRQLNAKISVYTKSGLTAQNISLYRPYGIIYAGVPDMHTARKLSIIWGVEPYVLAADSYENGLEKIRKVLISEGKLSKGDTLIETYRFKEGEVHTIKLVTV
ncbi:pyruvate kinase [Fervidicoccus fontis]|uniref:Pyruvate kinase n=1 Tax=Fervidicoccus fontis TaxID=683846 RepID=A0A843AJY6_9CREN|nr:pyruvate kinase [Fervidicoccus fontis]MBE9391740.1 pyruvate kinase [Fervidicoccus fontis]